jgi:hypothetical protein
VPQAVDPRAPELKRAGLTDLARPSTRPTPLIGAFTPPKGRHRRSAPPLHLGSDRLLPVFRQYSPDPDVRLIRNIWARKGVLERVRGVKFMYVGALCLQ